MIGMRTATIAAIGILLLTAPPASGDDPVEEARRLFDQGVAAVADRDFEAALAAFIRSYELNPAPTAAFNAALCHRELEDYPTAVRELRRLLDADEAGLSPGRRARAHELIEEMAPRVGMLRVRVGDPGAIVRIDGEDVGRSPIEETFYLEPGSHDVEVRWGGSEPERQTVGVPGGLAATTSVVFFRPDEIGEVLPRPLRAEPPDEGTLNEWWFWGAVSGAAAFGLTAVLTGTFALLAHDEWADGDMSDPGLRDRGIALDLATNVFVAGAAAAAVAAVALFFFTDFGGGGDEPGYGAAAEVGFLASAGAGALVLRW